MRQSRLLLSGIVTACLVLAGADGLFVHGAEKKSAGPKARAKDRSAAAPGRPSGVPRTPDAIDAGYGVAASDTITESVNEQGQTVYSVAAAHSDISLPLSEMAAKAGPEPALEGEEEEPSNPLLPPFRRIQSDVPDPVVQAAVQADESLDQRGFPLAAPSTGFNFAGVGISGGSPSDSNGSVGNDQFVETVNTRYQVWSLNRGTSVATSILGPSNIKTLWLGFGGPCEAQNGDPIVLYDKVANRWLISQFTTSPTSGVYYQCVAVSTTASATGTYARWAFAVPSNRFGDYPHFGVWTDAYYMMAHAFTAPSGGSYVAGIFAAMDRPKMLAGNPAATWQVILDPSEGGHMPADLDGFAPPPTNAPGIFLSLHPSSMWIYRMKVDFVTPANTVKTLQASVPVAASSGACLTAATPGTCIPQPGSLTAFLASLGDRLMYRAAYRNFIDHESLVISHSVDPSVSGPLSGVRWYDFRLSGTPNATCSTYPCVYQQGTVADVANGRNRWMPSIAMDTAENIVLGYSVSGKTANSENHTIRYTGRAKGDPSGTMTAPEVTIATGTKNNTSNSRWGDYTSMSVDPFDDCTFWYVNQYIPTTASSWATKIASAVWPAGSGAGQCPATTCSARPASAPTIGSASAIGPNQISVTWTGIAPTPGAYTIERANGACGSEGLYQPLAATSGVASTFTDTAVQGGLTYSYRVIAAADAAGKCQALVASDCVSATATGNCTLKPVFTGASSGASSDNPTCGVTLSWTPGTSSCPLNPNVRYDIFRGTTPDFVPSAGNRVAACVAGPSSYLDTSSVSSGVTYYYVVRAEDDTSGNGGECGGNEEGNSIVVSGTAYGSGTQASPSTWVDGGGDGTAFLKLNVAGTGDTADQAWRFVTTTNDAGANHTPGGAYAYRNAGPAAANIYAAGVCAEMQTPSLTVGAATTNLQYWERHLLEYHWDGVAVEYSRNGGVWTDVPAPSNSPVVGCSATDAITGWETLSCTGAPPANACGYATTKNAFNGPLGSGTSCTDWATSATVTSYAHRCHQIAGLTAGDTIQFRWRFASDPGAEFGGFYLDDVAITNIRLPNACSANSCAGQLDGTACNDGNACTLSDSCQGGVCTGSNPVVCTAQDQCHLVGTCNTGTGVCSNPAATAGTACGDPSSGACDGADTCNGAGVCQGNHLADGTSCGDTGTSCINQDTCLAGACHDNGFKTAGTACGDPTSNACTAADTCNGAGACQVNHSPDGTFCGDAGTACVNQDACLAGTCHDNGFKVAGTACGDPSSGSCDAADSCDGSGACQVNHVSDGTFCGDTGTACVNQDTCLSGACQDNGFAAAGTACGDASSGSCDAADACDGSGACQVNHLADGTFCGDAGTACVNQDTCLAGACQDNGFKAAGAACGDASSGACDAADACDGSGGCQVNHVSDGTFCGDAGTACVNQDTCLAGACQDNGLKAAGSACGDASSGSCDAADSCDGSGACQVNHVADGTICGDAGTACTNQDTCVSGACQDNGFKAADTACGSASTSACDNADSCDGSGACRTNHVADGTLCSDADPTTCGDACLGGACSGTAVAEPTEVNTSVRLAGDKSTIGWSDPIGPYNVYRGSNGVGSWAYDQTCFDTHQAGSSSLDSANPPSGTFFYYLISRVNQCRESVIGRNGAAAADPNTSPCVP